MLSLASVMLFLAAGRLLILKKAVLAALALAGALVLLHFHLLTAGVEPPRMPAALPTLSSSSF